MAGRIAYYGNIVTNGLVLNLDAAKRDSYPGSGTIWRDIAGGVITGSLTNGPTYNTSGAGSIVFDGVNDYGSLPYQIQSQFTNQISISAWVNPQWFDSGNNDGVNIIGKALPSIVSPYTIWALSISVNGKYFMSIGNGSLRTTTVSAESISLNVWTHLCGTYDGTTLKLYKNGTQDAITGTATYTLGQNTVPVTIGSWQTLSTYYDWFKGRIGAIQLYNRALTSTEILQNYNATKTRYQ